MTNIISDKDFTAFSEEELIKLADLIENKDKNSIFDVEYADGILNIIFFENGQTYVINKHSASKKIWFSSPISGANYFSYNFENKKWLDDKGKELTELLLLELTINFNFKL